MCFWEKNRKTPCRSLKATHKADFKVRLVVTLLLFNRCTQATRGGKGRGKNRKKSKYTFLLKLLHNETPYPSTESFSLSPPLFSMYHTSSSDLRHFLTHLQSIPGHLQLVVSKQWGPARPGEQVTALFLVTYYVSL